MSKALMNPTTSSKIGLILGSGLGSFAESVQAAAITPYAAIPGWPAPKAPAIAGHAGQLCEGRIGDTEVAILSGRCHLYEGYSPQEVVFGVRELHRRGVTHLIITNAAGGVRLDLNPGDLVLITDHINLTGANPLIGPNSVAVDGTPLGPRFPDMSDAYSAGLRQVAQAAAAQAGIAVRQGVYAGLAGPSFETPAEINYLRIIGADLVGMSTVLEVIAANHLGMRVLGISVVSNMAAGVLPQPLTHEEVLETGERVKDSLSRLLRSLIAPLAATRKC